MAAAAAKSFCRDHMPGWDLRGEKSNKDLLQSYMHYMYSLELEQTVQYVHHHKCSNDTKSSKEKNERHVHSKSSSLSPVDATSSAPYSYLRVSESELVVWDEEEPLAERTTSSKMFIN